MVDTHFSGNPNFEALWPAKCVKSKIFDFDAPF